MKGYYVIPTESDLIEITGKGAKAKAIKVGKKFYNNGDKEVFISHFDDDNPDGFAAGEETIFIKDLFK